MTVSSAIEPLSCQMPFLRTALILVSVLLSTILPAQDQLGHGYEFAGNGKDYAAERLTELYTTQPYFSPPLVLPNELLAALYGQQKWLSKRTQSKAYAFGDLQFTRAELQEAASRLIESLESGNRSLPTNLQLHQIKGEDGLGNVHFTGYFTPIVEVNSQPDSVYKFPFYREPKNWDGQLPTRRQIDGEQALAGKGLELAYSKSLLENYYMHVQGSGFVIYPDSSTQMLQYGGKNGHRYKSIGKYLVSQNYIPAEKISMQAIDQWFAKHPDRMEPVLFSNPSYTFFAPGPKRPIGAMGIPLEGGVSIAVDSKVIPLGACLLATVPVLNERGQIARHEYRILVAQDRGAAIRGSGHVDLYQGVGQEGLRKASNLHHYGKIWLLLPKGQ